MDSERDLSNQLAGIFSLPGDIRISNSGNRREIQIFCAYRQVSNIRRTLVGEMAAKKLFRYGGINALPSPAAMGLRFPPARNPMMYPFSVGLSPVENALLQLHDFIQHLTIASIYCEKGFDKSSARRPSVMISIINGIVQKPMHPFLWAYCSNHLHMDRNRNLDIFPAWRYNLQFI